MKSISFSHRYEKMPSVTVDNRAMLLQVFRVGKSNLSSYFLDYDTRYKEEGMTKHYPLKDGPLLLLLFNWDDTLMPTLRSWNESKEKYYMDSVGQYFEVIIHEHR